LNKRPLFIILLLLVCMIPTNLILGDYQATIAAKPAEMVLEGQKLKVNRWMGHSTIDVDFAKITGFTDYLYEAIQLDNGYEINIILKSKPPTNSFAYPVALKNAIFWYQPPLNEGDQNPDWVTVNATHAFDADGKLRAYRPINVVGSYAVYGDQRNGIYGTGKIMHIYRPLVYDSAGKSIWGVLSFVNNQLIVTVDQKWLNTAKYPVTVDPTFGIETTSSTTYNLNANTLAGVRGAPAAVGVAVSVHAYSEDGNWKGVLVQVSDETIIANGVGPAVSAGASPGWTICTYVTKPSLTVQNYYICIVTSAIAQKGDSTGAVSTTDTSNNYATPTDPTDGTIGTIEYCIYCTYTSVGTPVASISNMDTTDNCYTMYKYYTFTVAVTDYSDTISDVYLRGNQAGDVRFEVQGTTLSGTPAWAIQTGATTIDIDTDACSWAEDGDTWTATFSIRFEWDITSEEDLEIYAYVESPTETIAWAVYQSNYFDIIARLVASIGADDTTVYMGEMAHITGTVMYATTATGDTLSAIAPPDAQFTRVRLLDVDDYVASTDDTVVSGAYSFTFMPPYAVQTNTYHLYLDLLADFVDAEPANLPTVELIVTELGADEINTVFDAFGILTFLTTLSGMIDDLAGFFSDSVTIIVSSITMLFMFVVYFGIFILDWGIRVAEVVVYVADFGVKLWQGTADVSTGLGNLTTYFSISEWIDFIPIGIFVWWLGSIDSREKTTGQNFMAIAISDIQTAYGVLSIITSTTWTVFNFVVDRIYGFLSWLPLPA